MGAPLVAGRTAEFELTHNHTLTTNRNSDAATQQLMDSFVAWLESERAAMIALWESRGLSPTLERESPLGYREYSESENSCQVNVRFEPHKVVVSRAATPTGASPTFAWAHRPPVRELAKWLNVPVANASDDEVDRLLESSSGDFVRRLCGDYLSSLADPTHGDLAAARRLVADYLEFLTGGSLTEVSCLVLAGLTPPASPVEAPAGHVVLRALTAEELGEFHHPRWLSDDLTSRTVLPAALLAFKSFSMPMEGCLLTLRDSRPRGSQARNSSRLERTVLALQLLGFHPSGRGLWSQWIEPGPRSGHSPLPLELPTYPVGPEVDLASEDLVRACELATRVPERTFDRPKSRAELSLRRFVIAASQDDDSEAVIDYIIALEGLLLPGAQAELSFRFSLNGAHFIAEVSSERLETFRQLQALYQLRSKLVHGAGGLDDDERKQWRRTARSLARRGLLKAVESGWPTSEWFVEASLGLHT